MQTYLWYSLKRTKQCLAWLRLGKRGSYGAVTDCMGRDEHGIRAWVLEDVSVRLKLRITRTSGSRKSESFSPSCNEKGAYTVIYIHGCRLPIPLIPPTSPTILVMVSFIISALSSSSSAGERLCDITRYRALRFPSMIRTQHRDTITSSFGAGFGFGTGAGGGAGACVKETHQIEESELAWHGDQPLRHRRAPREEGTSKKTNPSFVCDNSQGRSCCQGDVENSETNGFFDEFLISLTSPRHFVGVLSWISSQF